MTRASHRLVRVLGPLEVEAEGRSVRLRPAQRRLLSILLLDPGEVVDRETLMDRMWGDEVPSTASSALQVHLSGIRKAAPGLIATVGSGYRAELELFPLDRVTFEGLATRAEAARASGDADVALRAADAARALWRGSPYPDLRDDAVAAGAIAHLLALHDDLAEVRADALLALGRTDEALEELRSLVRRQPLREPAWRSLMTALVMAGRRAEALHAYQEARATLASELGVEPGRGLRQLAERIVAGDEPTGAEGPRSAPTNLPEIPTSFVGREDELRRIDELLAVSRLVTITGAPGLGKTRLAIEAGHAARATSPDGVWFVPLADARSGQDAVTAIAAATGVRVAMLTPSTLAERLVERHATLVLDNCEHLADACAAFLEQLFARPGVLRVIATSRVPLRVPGEAVVRPAGLSAPDSTHVSASGALAWPAVRLFLDRARASDPGFRLTDPAVPIVVELCRATEGIPLAVELAAAWLPGLGLREIGAMLLGDEAPARASGVRPARQRSLRAAIAWSLELLAPDDRALLAALATFRGPCRLGDIASVCAPDWDWRRTAAAMQRLVDASLVVADRDDDGSVAYRLLVPIRDVARGELAELPASGEIATRFADHYLGKAAGPDGTGPSGPAALHALDADLDNLREACDLALAEGRADDVARVLVTLDGYFRSRFLGFEERAWLERALPEVRDLALRARTLAAAGLAAQATNRLDAALGRLEEARAAFAALGDRPGQARTLVALAGLHSNRGEWERGVRTARDAREMAGAADPAVAGLAAFYEGTNLAYGGHADDGIAAIEEAIACFAEADDAARLAHALSTLVIIATWVGEEALARRHVDAAILHARRSGSPTRVVRALAAAAGLEGRWGDEGAARQALLEVDREMGIPEANEDVFELLLPSGFLVRRLEAWPLLLDIVEACEAKIGQTGQGYGATWSSVTGAWRREAEALTRSGVDRSTGASPSPAPSVETVRRALRQFLGDPVAAAG